MPVYGLPRYPVNRYALPKAKIGLFSGGATAPANPVPLAGTTKSNCTGGFCEALFVLAQKMKIPTDMILPITTTDLTNGRLVNEGFTAFVNPATTVTVTAQLDAHQGVRQRRRPLHRQLHQRHDDRAQRRPDAGQHADDLGHLDPGLALRRRVRHHEPAGLGLRQRWLDLPRPRRQRQLRPGDAHGRRRVDPASRRSRPATAASASNGLMYKYGFDVNARGPTQLANRPAMIDQPFGQGRVLLLGTNPYYRGVDRR